MSELIHNLGIDWKVLIAQIVNFAILLFLLKKFAYKPILKILNERRQKIEEAIERSKSVDLRMQEIETLKQQVLDQARKESESILKAAEEAAQEVQENILKETHERSERLLKEAEKKIGAEREKLVQEVKAGVATVVTLAVEKTVGDVFDEGAQARMTEEALRVVRAEKII